MRHAIAFALVAAILACSSRVSLAVIYVAGADMVANELGPGGVSDPLGPELNPNGPWTYGTAAANGLQNQGVDLSTFLPYDLTKHTNAWLNVPQLQGYTDDDSDKTSIVVVNVESFPVGACCGFQIDSHKIFVHAGVIAQRDAVIQWTAPDDGYITIAAEWVQKGGAAGLHQVFQNDVSIYGPAFGTDILNSSIIPVNTGDVFSFVQGPQINGSFGSTSTQFDTSIDFTAGPLPTDRNWAFDRSGDWNSTSNWNPATVPNNNTLAAKFGAVISTPATVFTNSDVTVKQVAFDSSVTYAVAGTGMVNLQADTGNASISASQGTHEFQARVSLLSNTDADIAAGATIEFNNRLSLGGNTLTKSGDGAILINNTLNTGGGSVIVLGGTVGGGGSIGGNLTNTSGTVAPGSSAGKLTVQGNYTQAASGVLAIELGGTAADESDVLHVNQSATLGGTLAVSLANGFQPNTGDFFNVVTTGSGTSGTSFASITGVNLSALSPGFQLNKITDAQNVGLLAALPGDADLDQSTDFTDLGILLNNYNQSAGSGVAEWSKGDFNDDHTVDFTDLGILLNNYNQSVSLASGAAPVPEPGTLMLSMLGFVGLIAASRGRIRRGR